MYCLKPSRTGQLLTAGERRVMRARLEGLGRSIPETAAYLGVAQHTVKVHCWSVFRKLHVRNIYQAAVVLRAPLDSPFRKLVEERQCNPKH